MKYAKKTGLLSNEEKHPETVIPLKMARVYRCIWV